MCRESRCVASWRAQVITPRLESGKWKVAILSREGQEGLDKKRVCLGERGSRGFPEGGWTGRRVGGGGGRVEGGG